MVPTPRPPTTVRSYLLTPGTRSLDTPLYDRGGGAGSEGERRECGVKRRTGSGGDVGTETEVPETDELATPDVSFDTRMP